MNKVVLLIATFFIGVETIAQIQSGFHYRIKRGKEINYIFRDTTISGTDTTITITSHIVGVTTPSTVSSKDGSRTTVIVKLPPLDICPTNERLKAGLKQDDSGRVVIDFWGFTNDPAVCQTNQYVNSTNRTGLFYYKIPTRSRLSDITTPVTVSYTTWEFGAATIPFKYRFGFKKDTVYVPNDASLSVSAGVYFGKKWGRTKFFADKDKSANTTAFAVGAFVTPMAIAISKDNTFPTTDTVYTKRLEKKPNELGLSTGLGLLMSNRNLNFGILFGFDFGLTGLSHKWYYNKRPWFGVGFGYKLGIFGDK